MRAPTTPSSLKWLITRRARLDGELAKMAKAETEQQSIAQKQIGVLERQLASAEDAEASRHSYYVMTRKALEADLAATDLLLRQHEVPIDPHIISPVRSQDNLSIADHGFYTGCIYECLRLHNGHPCTATQVAAYIVTKLKSTAKGDSFPDLRYRMRKRMNHLAWEGK